MAAHQKIHMMNDDSVNFNLNTIDAQDFMVNTVMSFDSPFEKLGNEYSSAQKMEQSVNNPKVLKNMVLQQQVSAALSDARSTPFAPILKEKIEESVKGINQSKVKLNNYLRNSLISAQIDGEIRYRVVNDGKAPPVNDDYIDEYFSASPLFTSIRPRGPRPRAA
jgi:hypothetical protein